jgi:imidazolonepropionase-like amidohydrolase
LRAFGQTNRINNMIRCNPTMVLGLAIWLAAAIGLPCGRPVRAGQPPVLLRGGAVFDSVAGKLVTDRTVLIEGTRIKSVGTSRAEPFVPDGTRVIDARGKFILPGLIDAHVHLVHRLNFAHVTGDEVLPAFLAAGVTSVRNTGDEVVAQTLVARFAAAHPRRCPRVFTCSFLLDADPPIHRDIGLPISDPGRVPAVVADMAAWNVTTLKIYAGSGRAVGRRIIAEGHKRGLTVTGHLGNYPAREAAEDGIDCLEHITSVFDFIIPPHAAREAGHRATLDVGNPQAKALIATLAQRKVMVDPTLTVFKNMLLLSDLEEVNRHADNGHVPERLRAYWDAYRQGQGLAPATRERRRQEFRKYQELTGALFRAGVPLLAGTDTPEPYCPPGLALHQELELLVESGLTPVAALQAATINNARALKQGDELGSIEPGKLADLLILNADPTADIRNTRRIVHVIRDGVVCDPQALRKAVPVR